MNLTITQDNTRIETINSSIIDKLYEIAFAASSDPNSTVSLTGRLESPKGYAAKVEWLNTEFSPNLTITVPTSGQYILFEDSAIESLLISGGFSADGTGISLTDAANATFTGWNSGGTFYNNRDITSFNEFGYFTKANINPPACLFKLCTNLSEIDLSQVTKITDQEFSYAGLQDVNMPNLQITDGNSQFSESKVVTVTSLGNTITKIPNSCFFGCEFLTTVTLPQTVTEIGLGAFSTYNKYWTRKLTTVNGLDHVTIFGDGCFWGQSSLSANFSQLKNATSITGNAFYNCFNLIGEVDLPNIVSLSNAVFHDTKPTKIKCLGKVAAIPNSAFDAEHNSSNETKQSLTEVYLPYECTSIGDYSFLYRTRLATVKQYTQSIDNWIEGETPAYGDMIRITSIGREAFRYTALSGALSLQNLTTIGQQAFANTSLTSVSNLGSVTSLPLGTFYNCTALTSVTLPSTCISLDNSTFENCNLLTDINLSNVKSIGYKCFGNCTGINSIDLSSLINYGRESFVNCGNISITLPSQSINSGNDGMFGGNTRLLNVYGSVENWTTIHRNFPKFSDISSGIDVLYFKNATSIYAPKFGVNNEFGTTESLGTTSNVNVGTKAMYVPKLQEISCGITNTYNRLVSVFGIEVQSYLSGTRLKVDLLYFKDLLEIKSFPFGGLLCNALVINKSIPPTITPQTYSTIAEYNTSVDNVKVNAWGEIENATDPNATITGTTTQGWDYSQTKKLRHTPYITAIYVPDSAVNTYKTTTGWISVANLIQPISNLNSGIVYATQQDWETAGKPVGLIAECLGLSTADLATFMLDNNLTYWTNPNA